MLSKIIIFLVLAVFANGYADFEARRPPPDTGLNVKQLIRKYRYPFENHTVQTQDGYKLEMHRIPYGRSSSGNATRTPVLVVPGYLCSSSDWVNMGPENSLGFLLADEGYDVWLANYRGTRWSRKHAWLDPDVNRKEYWTYSFQQIGEEDLPTFIDYVLAVTNQEKLFYIGHSQGTSSFFALTSAKPEYNKKIRLSISISPVVYFRHVKHPLLILFTLFQELIEESLEKNQDYEFLPYNPRLALLARILCQDGAATQNLCALGLMAIAGYTPDQLNKTMIPVMLSNTPAGSSMAQMLHYSQMVKSKKFRKYDYGEEKNLEIYGQSSPPEYDLSKVTAPVAMYYGDRDLFCAKKDVDEAASEIPNLVVNKLIEGFNHVDVLWGIDVKELLYDDAIKCMKQY